MIISKDSPVRLVECLKSLGITKYEALVYIALLRVMSATATEIHAASGVPRASVYPVLDQLQDKELVSVSQSMPKRFAAISPDDAVKRLLGRIERDADLARKALSGIHHERVKAEQGSEELIWNIYGRESIRKKITALFSGAEHTIRIIAHSQIFSADMQQALVTMADHIKIEIITSHWEGEIPKKMKIFNKKFPEMPRELDMGQVMMAGGVCIIDGCKVLVIVGSPQDDEVALFSESEGFVGFFIRYYNLIFDWVKNTY
jgi:HTH-type transcriptional regulator, sugar sensing transcriptional regulator